MFKGSDGKPISNLEDNSALRFQRTLLHERMGLIETNANSEAAEDLFQNYSDSGSRPLTPAPTLASATTNKASQVSKRNKLICVWLKLTFNWQLSFHHNLLKVKRKKKLRHVSALSNILTNELYLNNGCN